MEREHHCEYRQRVEALEARMAKLEAELEKYGKPPKTSQNSSIPPSQDPYTKRYPKRKKSENPPGGQEGHKGHHHPFTEPDKIEPIYPDVCTHCGAPDLLALEEYRESRQEVALPQIQPIVTEYRQGVGLCRRCGKRNTGQLPSHLKAPVQMEQALSGLIGYLKQIGHLSHERIVKLFQDVFHLSLSKGFVANRLQALQQAHQGTYAAIGNALPGQAIIGSDETGHRINGKNNYLWVFQSPQLSYFVGNRSRGFEVIKELFGETFEGVWVSDRGGSQLKIRARHQLCLPHVIRNLQYAIDAENSEWAKALQTLFRQTMHYRKEQADAFDPVKNQDVFTQCEEYRRQLQQLFEKPPPEEHAKPLFYSLLGRQDQLLLFLTDPCVPYDNNASERALRQPVVHRKVLGGFRSDAGSKTQDVLLSVIETAKKQSLNVLDVLCNKTSLTFQS